MGTGTGTGNMGSGVGRGVKKKDLNVVNRKTVKDGVIPPIIIGLNSIALNFEEVMDGVVPSAIGASGNIQVENMGQSSSGPSLPISIEGLDAMLENGLWFIRNNPLILKKWHPNENLLKEYVSTVLVWVKLHGVHVTTFSDDGLSAIATKL
nr:hypothetical protein [Tanacetum cinerariifolium]